MFLEGKSAQVWDLADPRTQKSNFSSESFYVVIDGLTIGDVRRSAAIIKAGLSHHDVSVRGPLALPTERRRSMILRELKDHLSRSTRLTAIKRIRNVLLVVKPTSAGVSALSTLKLPTSVNLKIEPYEEQYELKEPV